MLFGILGAHDAALHQPANIGMVASQSRDPLTTHQIQAAVADMRKVELTPPDHECSAGRPHTMKLWMPRGIRLNPLVGSGKCLEQCRSGIVLDDLVVNFTNCFYRQAAGFQTTFVSAHAIGNYRQSSLLLEFIIGDRLPIEIGIL